MSSLLANSFETKDCAYHKEVIWYVKEVFLLPSPVWTIPCQEFYFACALWRMEIGPCPTDRNSCLLGLKRKGPEANIASPLRIRWKVGLKHANGVPYKFTQGEDCIADQYPLWTPIGEGCIVTRSELLQLKNSLVPLGQITAFCFLSVTGLNISENNTQTITSGFSSDKLVKDFKALLVTGEHSDVTITVKGRKFMAHRIILCGRVPVFLAMFRHQLKEATTGNVIIDDCDPDMFYRFLNYVYTGSTEDITVNTVFHLHSVADKYQMDSLKAECVSFLKHSLTVDAFCPTTSLALHQHEADLWKHCIAFFSENMQQIIKSFSWQAFITKYPVKANELLISALGSLQK